MTPRRTRGPFTRLVETVVVTSRLYGRCTADAQPPEVADRYTVRPASGADIARFACDLGAELRPGKAELVVQRASRPDIGLFVAVGPCGAVCGFGNTEHGRIRDEHLRLDAGDWPGNAHLFDDFVATAHRGHRLQAALLQARIRAAAEGGHGSVTILVEDSNHASRASVERAGFTPWARVLTLKRPGWRRSWVWAWTAASPL